MQAATACELPHSFDRVEFGTVRGKEVQDKTVGVLFPPRFVESRVVIRGVVGNDHNPSPGPTTGGAKLLEKLKEAGPIKFAVSRLNTNRPSRKRTAPKYPTHLRVGAWSRTGSLISGGIHMRQREPCC